MHLGPNLSSSAHDRGCVVNGPWQWCYGSNMSYYYYTYTVQWSENVDPERSIALSTQALYTVFTVPNTIIIMNNFIWWHRIIMMALKIQEQDQSSLHR